MNLGDLITALETADQNLVVANGFTNPHSYRGDYMDLAFEPAPTVPVTAMLVAARSALNTTYTGYKGGEFLMTADTWCWLSPYGETSCETLSPLALQAMLAQAADRAVLSAMFEGLERLLATSSRDWGTYRVDAWLYAVLVGWDCEQAEHDETCTHGAMEEMAAQHGWDADAVAKARRYRAAVRRLTGECPQCVDAGTCNGGPCPLSAPADRLQLRELTPEEAEEADRILEQRMAEATAREAGGHACACGQPGCERCDVDDEGEGR